MSKRTQILIGKQVQDHHEQEILIRAVTSFEVYTKVFNQIKQPTYNQTKRNVRHLIFQKGKQLCKI